MMNSLLLTLAQYDSSQGGVREEEVQLIALVIVMLTAIVVMVGISLLICFLIYTLLKAVPAAHRKMEPAMVWLLMIPLFNLIWNFYVFQNIADSYRSYFHSIGDDSNGDCGKTVGLWYAICAALSVIPCVNYISGPAALVLLIVYLVKGFGYKSKLEASQSLR